MNDDPASRIKEVEKLFDSMIGKKIDRAEIRINETAKIHIEKTIQAEFEKFTNTFFEVTKRLR